MAIDAIPNCDIMVGPLLGYEGPSCYTLCILSRDVGVVKLVLNGSEIPCERLSDTPNGVFWRATFDLDVAASAELLTYKFIAFEEVLADRDGTSEWSIKKLDPNAPTGLVYASCNGFSDAGGAKNTKDPYALWRRMLEMHGQRPFTLLLMGGDQLYADQIWSRSGVPELYDWAHLSQGEKERFIPSDALKRKIDEFYEKLYITHWHDKAMRTMLASVPSVMMWDDHDIFDGWGSYPDKIQGTAVYQEVFRAAKKYFEMFQIRGAANRSRIKIGAGHYSLGLRLGSYALLVLDNRSERSLTQIMSRSHWDDVKRWLQALQDCETLLVLTAVPPIYRSFAFIEDVMRATPWQEELEDDVNDHWSAKPHEGERMKLFMNLLETKDRLRCDTILVSGDVHVGALGVLIRKHDKAKIYQLVSTGVVHPPPSLFEWLGVKAATSDEPEELNGGELRAEMLRPVGGDKYIRSRNFATIHKGGDGKIWLNWICDEAETNPAFALERKAG